MKRKLTASQIINFSMGAIVVILIFGMIIFQYNFRSGYFWGSSSPGIVKRLKPIDPVVSILLPHYLYKQQKDSINFSRKQKDGMLIESVDFGPFGLQTNTRCENCDGTSFFDPEKKAAKTEYFIKLEWWKLDMGGRSSPTRYYVKNGQSYLRKTICPETGPKRGPFLQCTEADIRIPFRYNTDDRTILIPVSCTMLTISKFFTIGLGVLLFAYFVYFILGNFLKFLVEIAKGNPFSDQNIKRLKVITLSLFYIPISLYIINILLMLIFYSYFSKEVSIWPTGSIILWWPAILYLIFAALYAAFRKGELLKDENDLTV